MTIYNFPRAEEVINKLGLFYPSYQRFFEDLETEEKHRYKGAIESMLIDWEPRIVALKVHNAVKSFPGRTGWPSPNDIVNASQYEQKPKERLYQDDLRMKSMIPNEKPQDVSEERWEGYMALLHPRLRAAKYRHLIYGAAAYEAEIVRLLVQDTLKTKTAATYLISVKAVLQSAKGSPEETMAWQHFKAQGITHE